MIIPRPGKITELDGKFVLNSETKILFAKGTPLGRKLSEQLAGFLAPAIGYKLSTGSAAHVQGEPNSLFLTTHNAPARLGKEGYQLTVSPEKIIVWAARPAGLFYGLQSIRQLLPESIESNSPVSAVWKIPCIRVEDHPRFEWRGMHLDVCRHFFDIDSIKKYIDYLAMYKMNIFHWHLTEDQGWRIEIKKYPKLAEISSWRKGTNRHYWGCRGDSKRYGGYFKHDEIREIVAYAKDRLVTVVPEIEMPGHAQAALAGYPELSCTGEKYKVWSNWGVSKEVFCAGNNKVFEFIENVFDEILALFPAKYIHIGGDECPKDRWRACPKCQKRMRREGLADENELQSYFIKRIAKYIQSYGRNVIGWDEIFEGGLASGTAVMNW